MSYTIFIVIIVNKIEYLAKPVKIGDAKLHCGIYD